MRPVERLMDELNASFDGAARFGQSLRTALDGVTEEQARAHPLPNAHSILEIVVHAGSWMDMTSRRMRREAIEATTVEDWSDVTTHSLARATEELHHAHSRLLDALARTRPEELDLPLTGTSQTVRQALETIIQHNIYHAGQIALLQKQ